MSSILYITLFVAVAAVIVFVVLLGLVLREHRRNRKPREDKRRNQRG